MQPLAGLLHGHNLQEVVIRNPKLKVGGSQTRGWPANTWRVSNLIKSVTPPWTPINIPMSMEFKITHSTCSSSLVKVPV
jgi:hypothetical protein